MANVKGPGFDPATIPARTSSTYPEPYRSQVTGRVKRRLGDAAGLKNFGVNLVTLAPGDLSSMRHWHSRQDEFIFVVEGELVLVTDAGDQVLSAGMAAGFPAGKEDGHHLINRGDRSATYLEMGDRTPGDAAVYSDIDMRAEPAGDSYRYVHKDGTPY